jgi:hypothetical protein
LLVWREGLLMPSDTKLLEHLYQRFNARDVEAVLATMHRDVMWANGMEGGHVHGRDGVRHYWTRQWAMIDPHVELAGFSAGADGAVIAGSGGARQIPELGSKDPTYGEKPLDTTGKPSHSSAG